MPEPYLTPPDDALVVRHDHGGVTTLTFNRPKQLNSLSEQMLDALHSQLVSRMLECPDAWVVETLDGVAQPEVAAQLVARTA